MGGCVDGLKTAVVAACLILESAAGSAVEPGVAAPNAAATTTAATTAAAAPQPDYHPSLGDLMTFAIQPRHIKLGLAGKNANWAYATYELSELKNAFGRIARTIPTYDNQDTAAITNAMVPAPLAALDKAVKAADAKQFATAYEQLTATCNACHVAQKHAMVVIKVPAASMYPDQQF